MTNLSTVHVHDVTNFVSRHSANNTLAVRTTDNEITVYNVSNDPNFNKTVSFTPHEADRVLIAKALLPVPDSPDLQYSIVDELNRLNDSGLLAAAHAIFDRLPPDPVDGRDILALQLLAGYHGFSSSIARWASWQHVPVHLLEGVELVQVRARWRKVAQQAETLQEL